MTSPINMTFTPGTTITTDWCNGVNDAINNSTQDIAGSVPRTVPAKLADIISVKDYGAVGDGVTDDTEAVQAALDATWARSLTEALAGGVSLYFPAGIYKCGALRYGSTTAPWPAHPSRVYIYGEHASSIIASTVTTGQIALEFTKYTGISNFGGNTIENMMFRSINYQGIGLQFNATNWMTRVSGCIFQGFDFNYRNYSGITTTIQNSFFLSAQEWNYYSAPSPDTEAGYHETPSNLRFENNYLGQGLDATTGNVVYSKRGIGGDSATSLGANAVIKNNVFEGCGEFAIYAGEPDGSTGWASYTMDSNWFESPAYPTNKDQIYGAFKNSTITNNFSSQALLTNYGESFTLPYKNIMYNNSDSKAMILNSLRNMIGVEDTYAAEIGSTDVGVDFTGVAIGKKSLTSLIDADAYPLLVFTNGIPKWYINGLGQQVIQTDDGLEGQFWMRNRGATAGKQWHMGATNGNAFVVYNQNSTGVYMNDGGTSWIANSDERTKDIIEPIEDAANKVSSLRAVIGKYKKDEEGTRRSFLIAQDVQAVLPEAVNVQADEQGTLGVAYSDVIPLLVAAIKELKTEIDTLKSSK